MMTPQATRSGVSLHHYALQRPQAHRPRPPRNILQDTNVLFNGQPIAVVVARSLPEAEMAAKLLRHRIQRSARQTQLQRSAQKCPPTQTRRHLSPRRSRRLSRQGRRRHRSDLLHTHPEPQPHGAPRHHRLLVHRCRRRQTHRLRRHARHLRRPGIARTRLLHPARQRPR